MIKNLTRLKRALQKGTRFVIVYHFNKDCIGEERIVLQTKSKSFCSATEKQIKGGAPNGGKGLYMWYGPAKNWEFDGSLCTVYWDGAPHTPENRIMAFRILEKGAPNDAAN